MKTIVSEWDEDAEDYEPVELDEDDVQNEVLKEIADPQKSTQ